MNWEPFLLEKQAYAFGGPVMQAVLRASPEDFQVDEDLGFEPSGEGEHLFLNIRKRNQNTAWIADQLARLAGVKAMDVSYSGQKDRRAVTTQWFSIYWNKPELPDFSSLWNEDISLQALTRNNRKLRKGCHRGNRFRITLREVAGEQAAIDARTALLAGRGVPNYFGEQRFGVSGSNLEAGEALLQARVGGRGRRPDRRESIYLSALRSALFNRVLSMRVEAGNWEQQLPGDVLMLDGRNSFFTPGADEPDLADRLQRKDIHPTGPLFGRGRAVVSADVAGLEDRVAGEAAEIVSGLVAIGMDAQRRALRQVAAGLQHEWPDADTLVLTFTLPSGGFATSVLRELAELRTGSDVPVE